MQGCVASTIEIVLLTINRILKREKQFVEFQEIERGGGIADFQKTVNE